MRWDYREHSAKATAELSQSLGLAPELAEWLIRQGISHSETARSFLYPRLAQLEDPFAVTQLGAGVDRLLRAMQGGERIVILGDYDVDGVTSITLLVSFLRQFSVTVDFVVPRRLEEGYGLSETVVERIVADCAPDLLIALDCGTNAVAPVAVLRAQGIDVLIIDHHRCKAEGLPRDCILINPHVWDVDSEPWVNACTVGLVFKFVHGVLKKLRASGDELAFKLKLRDYLDLVALGTIADIVPLQGENRLMARYGLEQLRNTQRAGVRALMEVSGLHHDHVVQPTDIGFRIGPRINASGRLADAALPVRLLLSQDPQFCRKAAAQLESFNRERQSIERSMCQQAEQMVEREQMDSPAIVVWDPDWHPGVVGIVASRLARKYRRVSIVLGAEDSLAKGSGRSIPGISLTQLFKHCDHLLSAWGGHPMAVGVSLESEHVKAFRQSLNRALETVLADTTLAEQSLEIAAWLRPQQLGVALLEQLDLLGPFGEGNPEPVFGMRDVVLEETPRPFGSGHFRFAINGDNGIRTPGIAWSKGSELPPANQPLRMAIKLNWNQWNGQRYPQVELIDWKLG